jgi:ABC-type transport system substrate-binding protein
VIARQQGYAGIRTGNVGRVEYIRSPLHSSLAPYERDELDMITVRNTRSIADFDVPATSDAALGPAGWSGYLVFDHHHPVASNLEFRRALAHAVDREALQAVLPPSMVVATGGVVPPALQGHTPDIAPRFDPVGARAHLARSGVSDANLQIAALDEWEPGLRVLTETWSDVLGLRFGLRLWSHEEATLISHPLDLAPIAVSGWLPGYPDPEYFLRLLLHSDAATNEGGFAHPPFDELIERARQERSDRLRLELFHEADRMAVADRVAVIPLVYGRSMAFVKPRVRGWWEFGKTSAAFADLVVSSD